MPENEMNTVLKHAAYSGGIAILIRVILFFANYHSTNILDEIKLDLIIVLISLFFVLLILFIRIRSPITSLIKIDTIINKKFRKQFYKFIESDLDLLYHVLLDAPSKGGSSLDVNDVNTLTHICFELGESIYDGTDSNVPSKYYSLYPKYLEAHEKNINFKKNIPGSRILIIKREDLIIDFMNNYETSVKFVAWHVKNGVTLKVIEPSEAIDISKRYEIPENLTDIGIWHGKYILLFNPSKNGKIKLYMRFEGDKDYENTLKYFSELSKNASEVDLVSILKNGMMRDVEKRERMKLSERLFGYHLAIEWENFVNCEKRLEKEGPFLSMLIDKCKKGVSDLIIFDAAVGTGCESVYLRKKGIKKVISNEISPTFQTVAYQKAKDEGVKLEITSWNWLELDEKFKERYNELKVNMALILGNSLCLLTNKNEIMKSLSNIKSMLEPGGIVIVDERNFEYILKDNDTILRDPIRNFRYKKEVIYCGETVNGVPTSIDTNNVRFTYYKVPPPSLQSEINSSEILSHDSEYFIGTLDMQPFGMEDLENYLRDAGFINIIRYSDFEEGYDKEADFYIYVAQVPAK